MHTVKGTAANEADITQTAALSHGQEEDVFSYAGYAGADKRPELADREAAEMPLQVVFTIDLLCRLLDHELEALIDDKSGIPNRERGRLQEVAVGSPKVTFSG